MLCDRCGYEGKGCPYPQESHCEKYIELKVPCQNCEKETPKSWMRFTTDCHGIPFRYVCPDCYEKLMAKGYDGEHYTEADECIDYDY